jgi:phosphate transport system substrate-binding protein
VRARRTVRTRFLLALLAFCALSLSVGAPAASAAPARVNGSGSSYVALAMQQWVADAQTSGLQISYLPSGSPQGLTQYGQSLADFAGTEAEFSALGGADAGAGRGYQYVPDVAGAIAVMYNAEDKAGRKIDYLHLSRRTVARIFTGDISFWDDPAISADNPLPNGNLQLPHQPITVVYRGGQSGTTALFYDFVQHMAPDIFSAWAARNQFPTNVRIIALDSSPNFAPKTLALNGSDQIAQYLGSPDGKWSIGYDEFGYAKTYNVQAAWIQNESQNWVLPYAQNISSALEGATLRPDLSQELSGVYKSGNPDAYPISAYSYLVTQCANAGDRPTCKGPYANPGITETMTKWMRYIACDGQVNMARIGYSPLPPNLSQEIANSIGRMAGTPAEVLNAGNCANPRFKGSLGEGSSSPKKDPLKNVRNPEAAAGPATSGGTRSQGAAGSSNAASKGGPTAAGAAAATSTTVAAGAGPAADAQAAAGGDAGGTPEELAAAEALGETEAAAGAAKNWRAPSPAAYNRPAPSSSSVVPLLMLLALVAIPPIVFGIRRRPG